MRKIISILVLSFVFQMSFAQNEDGIKWYTFQEALALNEKAPKLIFVDVYTDWCGWCKKMDASTFSDASIAKYMNENYYCVKLDAEGKEPVTYMGTEYVNPNPEGKRSTHQIAALLLQNKMSYPSYVFLNGESKVLTVAKGYMDVAKFNPIIHWFGEGAYLTQQFQKYSENFQSAN